MFDNSLLFATTFLISPFLLPVAFLMFVFFSMNFTLAIMSKFQEVKTSTSYNKKWPIALGLSALFFGMYALQQKFVLGPVSDTVIESELTVGQLSDLLVAIGILFSLVIVIIGVISYGFALPMAQAIRSQKASSASNPSGEVEG